MSNSIHVLAEAIGAVSFSPPPMRTVRGFSFTYEQLEEFVEALLEKEREACAEICDDFSGDTCDAAQVIRERSPS